METVNTATKRHFIWITNKDPVQHVGSKIILINVIYPENMGWLLVRKLRQEKLEHFKDFKLAVT